MDRDAALGQEILEAVVERPRNKGEAIAAARGEQACGLGLGRLRRAIAAGDPDGAAAAMSDHLSRANALYSILAGETPAGAKGKARAPARVV